CYNQMHAPTCCNCGRAITDKCISAFGKKYHPDHFTCAGCGCALKGKQYKEDEGEPYCLTCKANLKKRIGKSSKLISPTLLIILFNFDKIQMLVFVQNVNFQFLVSLLL